MSAIMEPRGQQTLRHRRAIATYQDLQRPPRRPQAERRDETRSHEPQPASWFERGLIIAISLGLAIGLFWSQAEGWINWRPH